MFCTQFSPHLVAHLLSSLRITHIDSRYYRRIHACMMEKTRIKLLFFCMLHNYIKEFHSAMKHRFNCNLHKIIIACKVFIDKNLLILCTKMLCVSERRERERETVFFVSGFPFARHVTQTRLVRSKDGTFDVMRQVYCITCGPIAK